MKESDFPGFIVCQIVFNHVYSPSAPLFELASIRFPCEKRRCLRSVVSAPPFMVASCGERSFPQPHRCRWPLDSVRLTNDEERDDYAARHPDGNSVVFVGKFDLYSDAAN
jgi:hypothetical protein